MTSGKLPHLGFRFPESTPFAFARSVEGVWAKQRVVMSGFLPLVSLSLFLKEHPSVPVRRGRGVRAALPALRLLTWEGTARSGMHGP